MSLAYSYLLFIVLAIFLFCYFTATWVWNKVVERNKENKISSNENKKNRRDFQ